MLVKLFHQRFRRRLRSVFAERDEGHPVIPGPFLVPADVGDRHAHLAGQDGRTAHRFRALVHECSHIVMLDGMVRELVRIEYIEFLFVAVGDGVSEDRPAFHISFIIPVRNGGAAAVAHHPVPELARQGAVDDHHLGPVPVPDAGRTAVVLGHAAHQLPVPGVGIQEHHG